MYFLDYLVNTYNHEHAVGFLLQCIDYPKLGPTCAHVQKEIN